MALDDMAVRREVILPVDRDTAWSALTDPAQLATWLAEEVELIIEAGAEGWLRSSEGLKCRVTVEEVVNRRRVVLRWQEPHGPETIVELVLDDMPVGTRLVVLEVPVAELRAVGAALEQVPRAIGGPGLGSPGPQMVAALR